MFITVFGPFLFVEANTKLFGKHMEKALKRAYNDGPINGKMQYYRITWYTPEHAQALIVGEEKAVWGGTDRPVMGVSLDKKGGEWKAVSYHVIYSDRLNKDGLVIPPYR